MALYMMKLEKKAGPDQVGPGHYIHHFTFILISIDYH